MEITSIVIGSLVLGFCMLFISRPFQQKQHGAQLRSNAGLNPGLQRRVVLTAIRDLDFDYRTGKMSEDDYSPLRAHLLSQAAQLFQKEQQEDENLEALIRDRRSLNQAAGNCQDCGAAVQAGEHFCSRCGSLLAAAACSACGRNVKPGDVFCSACGSRIEIRVDAAG